MNVGLYIVSTRGVAHGMNFRGETRWRATVGDAIENLEKATGAAEDSVGNTVGNVAPTGQTVVYNTFVLVMMTSVARAAGQCRTALAHEVTVMRSVA